MSGLKKYYSLIAALALVLALAIFGALLYSKISSLYRSLVLVKTEVAAVVNRGQGEHEAEAILKSRADDLKAIDYTFVSESSIINFIEKLEQIAKNSNVSLKVSAGNPVSLKDKIGPTFSLEASGDFQNIFRYLLLLENMPYEISFENASIVPKVPISKDLRVGAEASYQIRIKSYIF